MIRHCVDCQAPFSIEPEEEDWFHDAGMTLPKRCPRCRGARREVQDEYRKCQRCGRTYLYPREIQLYARSYGWAPPRHCVGGCPDHRDAAETDEERGMRELLEQLRDRRAKKQAPPIEAALAAQRGRPRPPPRAPDPGELFRGLGGEHGPGAAEVRLRDEVGRREGADRSPDDLFASLAGPPQERRKGPRKKRRPRRRGGHE